MHFWAKFCPLILPNKPKDANLYLNPVARTHLRSCFYTSAHMTSGSMVSLTKPALGMDAQVSFPWEVSSVSYSGTSYCTVIHLSEAGVSSTNGPSFPYLLASQLIAQLKTPHTFLRDPASSTWALRPNSRSPNLLYILCLTLLFSSSRQIQHSQPCLLCASIPP